MCHCEATMLAERLASYVIIFSLVWPFLAVDVITPKAAATATTNRQPHLWRFAYGKQQIRKILVQNVFSTLVVLACCCNAICLTLRLLPKTASERISWCCCCSLWLAAASSNILELVVGWGGRYNNLICSHIRCFPWILLNRLSMIFPAVPHHSPSSNVHAYAHARFSFIFFFFSKSGCVFLTGLIYDFVWQFNISGCLLARVTICRR